MSDRFRATVMIEPITKEPETYLRLFGELLAKFGCEVWEMTSIDYKVAPCCNVHVVEFDTADENAAVAAIAKLGLEWNKDLIWYMEGINTDMVWGEHNLIDHSFEDVASIVFDTEGQPAEITSMLDTTHNPQALLDPDFIEAYLKCLTEWAKAQNITKKQARKYASLYKLLAEQLND